MAERMVRQIERDLWCLQTAGYAVIRDFLPVERVDAIEAAAVAFESEVEEFAKGGRPVILQHNWPLRTTRCLYAVSTDVQDYVLDEYLQAMVRGYLGEVVLRDCLLQTLMPDGRNAGRGVSADLSFHRDTLWGEEEIRPHYLHAFLMLNDCKVENGATVVVPGTHRSREPGYYFKHSDPRPRQPGIEYAVYEQRYFPSALPVEGKRGTLLLLDPMTIHTQGNNTTNQPRRLLNATFRWASCRPSPKLLNARRIAERHARIPIRPDLVPLLEDDPTLPERFGPLGVDDPA